jgi:hypothetical protein
MKVRRVRPRGDDWIAHLEPCPGVYVGATGETAEEALHHAAKLVHGALSNPAVQSVLPPGTMAAVALLRGATAAIRRGNLDEYLTTVPAHAARTVLKTLRKVLPW